MEISPFKTQKVQEENNQEKAHSHSKYRDVYLQKAALKTLGTTTKLYHTLST